MIHCYPLILDTLGKLLQPVTDSSLRGSTSIRLVEPFLSRKITIERSFCHCVPSLYNQMPFELCTIEDLSTCKKKLKTFFLKLIIQKI